MIISRDVLFNEKTTWNWEQGQPADSKDVFMEEIHTKSAMDIEENENSSQISLPSDQSSPSNESLSSSSSSPSLTPQKMKSLAEIYKTCNFCVFEHEKFEEAVKDKA